MSATLLVLMKLAVVYVKAACCFVTSSKDIIKYCQRELLERCVVPMLYSYLTDYGSWRSRGNNVSGPTVLQTNESGKSYQQKMKL